MLGGSSDIGRALIRTVSDSSLRIIAHYREGRGKLEALKAEGSFDVIPVYADLRREDDAQALIDAVEKICDCPDKIVHLAAQPVRNIRFRDTVWTDFQDQIDVQLRGPVTVLRRFLSKMAKSRRGKVVVVLSSYTAGVPPAALAHYVTAKYALLGLVKSLAAEFADKGICINGVSPSMVETAFLGEISEKLVEMAAYHHPLKRNATPMDVVPAIQFLLSEESNFITGVNLPVTGGLIF